MDLSIILSGQEWPVGQWGAIPVEGSRESTEPSKDGKSQASTGRGLRYLGVPLTWATLARRDFGDNSFLSGHCKEQFEVQENNSKPEETRRECTSLPLTGEGTDTMRTFSFSLCSMDLALLVLPLNLETVVTWWYTANAILIMETLCSLWFSKFLRWS